jgi:hypothetical protein
MAIANAASPPHSASIRPEAALPDLEADGADVCPAADAFPGSMIGLEETARGACATRAGVSVTVGRSAGIAGAGVAEGVAVGGTVGVSDGLCATTGAAGVVGVATTAFRAAVAVAARLAAADMGEGAGAAGVAALRVAAL